MKAVKYEKCVYTIYRFFVVIIHKVDCDNFTKISIGKGEKRRPELKSVFVAMDNFGRLVQITLCTSIFDTREV